MIHRTTIGCMLFFIAVAASHSTTVTSEVAVSVENQRRDYQAAIEAVKAGNLARFKSLSSRLADYVLYGRLQYEYLADRIETARSLEILKFLDENSHAPWANMLRRKWLHHLADRGRWDLFMEHYVDAPDDTELVCLYLSRRVRTEQTATLMTRIESLWLTGRSLPSACNPVFAAWKKAGHMGTEKVWERIRLAMESRNVSFAGELAIYLPSDERVWVNRWRAMHNNPIHELDNIKYAIDTPVTRMIVKHGIVRLAYRDPEEAMRRWELLKTKHQFFGEDENYVLRLIGILAAQSHLPEALKWLTAVSVPPDDINLQVWRVRAALRAGEWEIAKNFIAALPESEQMTNRWRYWRARILELQDEKRKAKKIYSDLARDRDFYGFLAADRLGVEYSMQHVSVDAKPEELDALRNRPGVRVAQELYALGQVNDARRQWNYTIREMNNRELEVAAVIANEWGWYDRAVHTASLSNHPHDLDLRFPVAYREVVESNAAERGIDPGWVYGVVRQESAFVVDARSHAGALGLMQLMPATGRSMSRKLRLNWRGTHGLLDIEHNVRLGVSYLQGVLERYNGHQTLATASYNAGPNRVAGWLPRDRDLAADVWIETIPFNETNGYVKNVLAFAAVYDYRLDQPLLRLSTRMPEVTRVP